MILSDVKRDLEYEILRSREKIRELERKVFKMLPTMVTEVKQAECRLDGLVKSKGDHPGSAGIPESHNTTLNLGRYDVLEQSWITEMETNQLRRKILTRNMADALDKQVMCVQMIIGILMVSTLPKKGFSSLHKIQFSKKLGETFFCGVTMGYPN